MILRQAINYKYEKIIRYLNADYFILTARGIIFVMIALFYDFLYLI